ncbi:unnamed protein product [Choristocarpus tenellus]
MPSAEKEGSHHPWNGRETPDQANPDSTGACSGEGNGERIEHQEINGVPDTGHAPHTENAMAGDMWDVQSQTEDSGRHTESSGMRDTGVKVEIPKFQVHVEVSMDPGKGSALEGNSQLSDPQDLQMDPAALIAAASTPMPGDELKNVQPPPSPTLPAPLPEDLHVGTNPRVAFRSQSIWDRLARPRVSRAPPEIMERLRQKIVENACGIVNPHTKHRGGTHVIYPGRPPLTQGGGRGRGIGPRDAHYRQDLAPNGAAAVTARLRFVAARKVAVHGSRRCSSPTFPGAGKRSKSVPGGREGRGAGRMGRGYSCTRKGSLVGRGGSVLTNRAIREPTGRGSGGATGGADDGAGEEGENVMNILADVVSSVEDHVIRATASLDLINGIMATSSGEALSMPHPSANFVAQRIHQAVSPAEAPPQASLSTDAEAHEKTLESVIGLTHPNTMSSANPSGVASIISAGTSATVVSREDPDVDSVVVPVQVVDSNMAVVASSAEVSTAGDCMIRAPVQGPEGSMGVIGLTTPHAHEAPTLNPIVSAGQRLQEIGAEVVASTRQGEEAYLEAQVGLKSGQTRVSVRDQWEEVSPRDQVCEGRLPVNQVPGDRIMEAGAAVIEGASAGSLLFERTNVSVVPGVDDVVGEVQPQRELESHVEVGRRQDVTLAQTPSCTQEEHATDEAVGTESGVQSGVQVEGVVEVEPTDSTIIESGTQADVEDGNGVGLGVQSGTGSQSSGHSRMDSNMVRLSLVTEEPSQVARDTRESLAQSVPVTGLNENERISDARSRLNSLRTRLASRRIPETRTRVRAADIESNLERLGMRFDRISARTAALMADDDPGPAPIGSETRRARRAARISMTGGTNPVVQSGSAESAVLPARTTSEAVPSMSSNALARVAAGTDASHSQQQRTSRRSVTTRQESAAQNNNVNHRAPRRRSITTVLGRCSMQGRESTGSSTSGSTHIRTSGIHGGLGGRGGGEGGGEVGGSLEGEGEQERANPSFPLMPSQLPLPPPPSLTQTVSPPLPTSQAGLILSPLVGSDARVETETGQAHTTITAGLHSAINSIEAERERLLREIVRLRNQQAESLQQLIALQREQVRVRQRQTHTLSNILEGLVRTVASMESLPEAALNHLTTANLSTHRRLLLLVSTLHFPPVEDHAETGGEAGATTSSLIENSASSSRPRELEELERGVVSAIVSSSDLLNSVAPSTSSTAPSGASFPGSDTYSFANAFHALSGQSLDSTIRYLIEARESTRLSDGGNEDIFSLTEQRHYATSSVLGEGGTVLTDQQWVDFLLADAQVTRSEDVQRRRDDIRRFAQRTVANEAAVAAALASFQDGIDGAGGASSRSGGCSMATIASLRRATYQPGTAGGSVDSTHECVICLSEFAVGDMLCYLPCSHVFHQSCVGTWLANHRSCPTCRSRIPDVGSRTRVRGRGVTDSGRGTRIRANIRGTRGSRAGPVVATGSEVGSEGAGAGAEASV